MLTGVAATTSDVVAVWNSLNQDGDSDGVFARRFEPNGLRTGPEFRVNDYTTGEQSDASIATLTDGSFVVAWSSPQDASEYAIVAARFTSTHALAQCGDADAGGDVTARDALLVGIQSGDSAFRRNRI